MIDSKDQITENEGGKNNDNDDNNKNTIASEGDSFKCNDKRVIKVKKKDKSKPIQVQSRFPKEHNRNFRRRFYSNLVLQFEHILFHSILFCSNTIISQNELMEAKRRRGIPHC